MGIKMKFSILVAYVAGIAAPSCDSTIYADGVDGGCVAYTFTCGSNKQCSGEACCGKSGLSSYPGSLSCRTRANPCFRRNVLKEEDDFDSLDDLELEEQGGMGDWG